MDLKELKQDYPELYQAVLEEGRASVELPDVAQIRAEAQAAGTETERARCLQVFEAGGPVELTREALEAGTEPGAHALAVLKAERAGRATALDDLGKSLGASAGHGGTGHQDGGEVVDFMSAVAAKQKAEGISKAAAIRAVRAEQPDLTEAHSAACCQLATGKQGR